MASESDRITKNKRIELPGGAEVLFPVVTRISFTDASDRYQETQHAIDNTEVSDRSVHVAWVGGSQASETPDPDAEDPGDTLKVERIDTWRAIDAADRNQEIFTTIDNKTKDDNGPPYFTNHVRTHVLRVLNNPDDGNWIETEVIDEFSFLDPSDRNQETRYTLENPPGEPDADGNLIIRANPDDEEMDGGEAVDPPYRTDPFQNIVKISEGYYALVLWTWSDWYVNSASEVYLLNPAGNIFVPGIASIHQNASSNNNVTFTAGSSVNASLVFNSGFLGEDTGTFVDLGLTPAILQFGPCEYPLGTNPAPNVQTPGGCPDMSIPPPHMPFIQTYDSSASLPVISYQRSFLFKTTTPTPHADITAIPPKIVFNVSNAIDQTAHTTNYGSYPAGGTPNAYTQTTECTYLGGFRFTVYLFSSSLVEVFEDDPYFPLRKRNDNPTANPTSSLADTLALPHTVTTCNSVLAYNEGANIVPVMRGGTYEMRIESFVLQDDPTSGRSRSIPWPKQPSFVTSAGTDYRLYHYDVQTEVTGESIENDPPDIKFGTPPAEVTA